MKMPDIEEDTLDGLEAQTAYDEHKNQIGGFAISVTELEFKTKNFLPPAEVASFAREVFAKEIEEVTIDDINKLNKLQEEYTNAAFQLENIVQSIFWKQYYLNRVSPETKEVMNVLRGNLTGRQNRLIDEELNYEE